MKFISVSARNFLSFKELEFTFPESGLYFIGGEVVGSTSSSSNGAGKSSIFEALCWGTFGSLIRNISNDDVVNREVGKDCKVIIVFEDDSGKTYKIERSYDKKRKHQLAFSCDDNDLTEGIIRETQASIDRRVGMSWEVFSTAVVFGEKAQRFTEAAPSEKKKLLDEILQFSVYGDALKSVRDQIKETAKQTQALDSELNRHREGLRVAQDTLDNDIEPRIKSLQKAKDVAAQQSAQIGETIKSKESEKVAKDSLYTEIASDRDSLTQENTDLMVALRAVEQQKTTVMTSIGKKVFESRLKLEGLKKSISELANKISSAKRVKTGVVCSVCFQEVKVDSIQSVVAHFEEERKTLESFLAVPETELKAATAEESVLKVDFDTKAKSIADTKMQLDEMVKKLNNDLSSVDLARRILVNEIKTLENQSRELLAKHEHEEQALNASWERTIAGIAVYQEKIAAGEQDAADIKTLVPYLEFWEDGFGSKGITSFLLDEILPQLNTQTAFYASALFDAGVRIEFDTESTTKGGDIKDEFNIKVIIGDAVLDYKTFSFGEKRRIDVAVLMALQMLVFNRSVGSCNLTALDEVFESLDNVGIERVANILNEEAKKKAIFVISHNNDFSAYFDNVILVRKKDGFSTIDKGGVA